MVFWYNMRGSLRAITTLNTQLNDAVVEAAKATSRTLIEFKAMEITVPIWIKDGVLGSCPDVEKLKSLTAQLIQQFSAKQLKAQGNQYN